MTMRYAAVMPETLRQEFDQAFAAIDDEHRITTQVHVVLSPEAHLAAATAWRESLWVDLGIGWCGLSASEPVNPGETGRLDNYCAGVTSTGLLIQAGPGNCGGTGAWRTKRSGWSA
jgi:hypothetical protein